MSDSKVDQAVLVILAHEHQAIVLWRVALIVAHLGTDESALAEPNHFMLQSHAHSLRPPDFELSLSLSLLHLLQGREEQGTSQEGCSGDGICLTVSPPPLVNGP